LLQCAGTVDKRDGDRAFLFRPVVGVSAVTFQQGDNPFLVDQFGRFALHGYSFNFLSDIWFSIAGTQLFT
jgi:hypothetical protein